MWLLLTVVLISSLLLLVREGMALSIRNKNKISSTEGIDVMEYVEINGIQQAIHIRGQNLKNPVILFLHGGPGFTDMPVSYRYQPEWESHFTIVQWDQRLAGKTYLANKAKLKTNTCDGIELRVSDCIVLTKYLLERFGIDKVVLMGHSWGTILGIHAIKEAPELYSSYIGISQQVNLRESETLGYGQTLKLAREAVNRKDTKILEALLPYPDNGMNAYYTEFPSKMMTLRKLQGKYEIGMPASYTENIQYFLPSPYYSLHDLTYYFTDVFKHNRALYKWLYEEYDLHSMNLEFTVPTIFIYGSNDWTTPPEIFKNEIFETIQSPLKELYIVDNAAHRPMNDNAVAFNQLLFEKVHPLACGR